MVLSNCFGLPGSSEETEIEIVLRQFASVITAPFLKALASSQVHAASWGRFSQEHAATRFAGGCRHPARGVTQVSQGHAAGFDPVSQGHAAS